jgi:hypothetical protein
MLIARSHVLLMLRVAWMWLLLRKLLVDQIELSSNVIELISNQAILDVIMSPIVNDLFVYFLLSVAVISLVIVLIVVPRFVRHNFVLAI